MSVFDGWSLADLLDEIAALDWIPPVRAMEAVLERGEDGLESVLERLRQELEAPEGMALWLLTLAGAFRSERGVRSVLDALRSEPGSSFHMISSSAAESLGRIGPPAVGPIRDFLGAASEERRVYLYAALGWIGTDEAHAVLVDALESDPEMSDVIAMALADVGRREDIPLVYAALARAPEERRADIEDALLALHRGPTEPPPSRVDWRLRCRPNPRFRAPDPTWPMIWAVLRDAKDKAAPPAAPLRSLEEILADDTDAARRQGERGCEVCGRTEWRGTGVEVCACTATRIALLQHHLLGELRDREDIEDLFDVLDLAEDDLAEALHAPEPRGRRKKEKHEDHVTRLQLLRGAARWLIERGIEDIGGGRAALLAEAQRLAAEYGDPDGFFQPPPVRETTPPVGRNDPCPCGSGRKYKKCCGKAGPLALAGPPGTRPRLVTFDGEPVSFCQAHYHVSDPDAAFAALAGCEELDADPERRKLTWRRPVDADQRRILGSMRFEDGRLVLECMSKERLDRGRQLIESLAGEWLTHGADSIQDPWQAVAEHEASGRVRPPAPSGLSPEEEGALIREVLERHYRTWPDEPLPALGGRTAREAVRSAAGREEVATLLASMEATDGQQPATHRYDFSWIWKELGIEDLR